MENNNFNKLLNSLQQNEQFREAISKANQLYMLKSYKIADLTPTNISELYEIMRKK